MSFVRRSRTMGLALFVLVPVLSLLVLACSRRAPAGGGTIAAPAQPGTTLTPDAAPLCGDFGRRYIAPASNGQLNPTAPPENLGVVDARGSRIFREGGGFDDYSTEDQDLIRTGRARVGLDERAVYLASGLPAFYWNTTIDETNCRVMLFGILGEPVIDTAIYSCGGVVTHIGPVQPQLPCWRLEEVAPRAVERAAHFDGSGVERQWEILHGLLQRGQSTDDVYVGFGAPYRTGLEAREDGTNAAQHVYLDTTGDAYATYLTFVDGNLRGWRFPPDRQLTAEAQQRRLDAMERRMMSEMREIEEASMARHQEEMARMNDIQQNQERIRVDIANARTAVLAGVEEQAIETRDQITGQDNSGNGSNSGNAGRNNGNTRRNNGNTRRNNGNARPPSGCQTFTFNGSRYSDRHGTPMGRPCNNGCPAGYVCLGNIDRCMPSNPQERCP